MLEEKEMGSANGEEEEVADLEGHFILRLPPRVASSLSATLNSGGCNLQSRLKIKIEQDMRNSKILYDGWSLTGKVMDLPTVLECIKTLDRKVFYKVADVCQIIICEDDDFLKEVEEPTNEKQKDKMNMLPHGLSLPLKNVKRRRFRRTLKKKSCDIPDYEKEVKILFKTDLEAISVRYELVSADEDKQEIKSEINGFSVENSMDAIPNVDEAGLFGEVSSSSEDSDDEAVEVVSLEEELEKYAPGFQAQDSLVESFKKCASDNDASEIASDNDVENASILQQESETAGENLGQLLKEQIAEDEEQALYQKCNALEGQILAQLKKQRDMELEILTLGNELLRVRFKYNIDQLKQDICEKQRELNSIRAVLQGN